MSRSSSASTARLERRLRLAGHGEQADLDVAELVVKMPVSVEAHPNLPVM